MKKFGQILALVFMLAFGYGLGQHAQDLFATDYPTGGAGGGTHPVNLASDVTGELPHGETSDDAANVHGLGSSVNVLGNRDASGEFIQRATTGVGNTTGTDRTMSTNAAATITFSTAYSATPLAVVASPSAGTVDIAGGVGISDLATTGFTRVVVMEGVSRTGLSVYWIAVGN
ncbi:MAG TPA: hypothetical protein ENI05_01955 [Porticoccus sp.]|nr:hypothetical protein [Porticoccus sp.]